MSGTGSRPGSSEICQPLSEPAAVRGAGNGPEKGPTAALLPGSGLFTRHQNLRSRPGVKPSFDSGLRSLSPACCHAGIYSQKSLSFPLKSVLLPLLFMSRKGGGSPECVAWGDPSSQGRGCVSWVRLYVGPKKDAHTGPPTPALLQKH